MHMVISSLIYISAFSPHHSLCYLFPGTQAQPPLHTWAPHSVSTVHYAVFSCHPSQSLCSHSTHCILPHVPPTARCLCLTASLFFSAETSISMEQIVLNRKTVTKVKCLLFTRCYLFVHGCCRVVEHLVLLCSCDLLYSVVMCRT